MNQIVLAKRSSNHLELQVVISLVSFGIISAAYQPGCGVPISKIFNLFQTTKVLPQGAQSRFLDSKAIF
jgi:purine nucleoside phosphorylase